MASPKKKFVAPKTERVEVARGPEGMMDEQVGRILQALEANQSRLDDLNDTLGGVTPRNPPDQPDFSTIFEALDYIMSCVVQQGEAIDYIQERVGPKIGRIKLY